VPGADRAISDPDAAVVVRAMAVHAAEQREEQSYDLALMTAALVGRMLFGDGEG
jgi:hypothetical protein